MIIRTENVQAARQIRFTNADQIVEMEPILKAHIRAAIELEKAGGYRMDGIRANAVSISQ